MEKEGIKKIIEKNPILKDKLFARGFLFTNARVDETGYPFYGIWGLEKVGDYNLLVAKKQNYYIESQANVHVIMVGHAYDPFTMETDEKIILKSLLAAFFTNKNALRSERYFLLSEEFWNQVNQLTGVFTVILLDENDVFFFGDASGMQTTFYTVKSGKVYISSHTNLIGDLLSFVWDPYVEKLVQYRFFKLFGNALPGNLSQFRKLKRVIPNHYVQVGRDTVKVVRFYWPQKLDVTRDEIVCQVASLLHNNMELISRKWSHPAISLTGGCDSKTTLACANGVYDRYTYFSYISSDAEKVDAEAASVICEALHLQHTIHEIPKHEEGEEAAAEILNWNTGDILYSHLNDVRKRLYFADTDLFDVEVKSWASEIGRAYYSKRFHGRTDFGTMTPRKCTTLYKFFLHNRILVRQTDKVFASYIRKYFQQAPRNPIEWQEQFFWEFRVPSWNGLVITGEHRYSYDITIPYNNRRILELLLSATIEDRLSDRVYRDVRQTMNPEIDQTGITVTNLKHTKRREIMENVYYAIHSSI